MVKGYAMKLIFQQIEGIDGTQAELRGYLLDNFECIDADRRRPAVLILPGGAYRFTVEREGEPVAVRMLSYGYQAFVLHYSVAPSVYPTSTLQVAEAVRRIRASAEDWHIDPDAIVVAGFSAGGHAAALFAESWDSSLMDEHGFARNDVRPNGLLLGYPVITAGEYAHRHSIDNILGPERADDPIWLDRMSLEHHVTPSVPPTFLWTTATDTAVPAMNSLLFAQALAAAGMNYELHIFPEGKHGSALATGESAACDDNVVPCAQVWPRLFEAWMQGRFATALSWKR